MRYFFANRRWVAPDVEDEHNTLKQGWQNLCEASIVFKGQCKFDHLVTVITRIRDEWASRVKSRELHRRVGGWSAQGCMSARSRPDDVDEGEGNEKGPAKRPRRGSMSGSVASTESDSSTHGGAVHLSRRLALPPRRVGERLAAHHPRLERHLRRPSRRR